MVGVFPGGIYLPASLGFQKPDFALFLGLISQIRKLAAYKPNVGIREYVLTSKNVKFQSNKYYFKLSFYSALTKAESVVNEWFSIVCHQSR